MAKSKGYNQEFLDLIKELDSYVDEKGNITDEKYHEVNDKIQEMAMIVFGFDDMLDEINKSIEDVRKELKQHIHKNGTVYVKL